MANCMSYTQIKKYSSYIISGNSDEIGCKVIYEEGLLIEEMRKYFTKYEEEVISHI
jgi:hypothetical protein